MSLIVEVHGVNGVGEGDVIWMEPILFVSVTDSFLSLNVLKLYNQCPERSGISTICSKSVFRKAIENIRKMYRTSVPATRNFVLFFFVLMTCKRYSVQTLLMLLETLFCYFFVF